MAAALLREAVALYESGSLASAREAAEDALHAADPHNDTLFAEALLVLANVYCAAEDFAEAERLVATCCCYVEQHLGPAHIGVATARLNRAIILLERYRLRGGNHDTANTNGNSNNSGSGGGLQWVEQAYALLQAAARQLENVDGVERLLLAEVLHNTGVCCELVGRHVDALAAYMRSMQIRVHYTDTAGVCDLKLALTMEHVAMLYRLLQGARLQEAARLMDAVATTRRRYLGPRHPLFAAAILAQGVIAAELGHKRRAVLLLQKALDIRKRLYGEEDPQTRCVAQLLAEIS
ncbi:uncharacterized protein TM35_000302360 [Trypanosoma theileri]|uniref:Uncharacterized protein n=1 Tax=Trypanosoma theileri TaxID=67003 RepID=A0A1X0NNA0_9TRYP|nr:uncharacterized protein TM35_000302360 [Trypanosoma theileri]ORC86196.1 hypothetical protein TM35_000302360 [Trypanosoma theileri]